AGGLAVAVPGAGGLVTGGVPRGERAGGGVRRTAAEQSAALRRRRGTAPRRPEVSVFRHRTGGDDDSASARPVPGPPETARFRPPDRAGGPAPGAGEERGGDLVTGPHAGDALFDNEDMAAGYTAEPSAESVGEVDVTAVDPALADDAAVAEAVAAHREIRTEVGEPLLRTEGLTVRFGGLTALDSVSFE